MAAPAPKAAPSQSAATWVFGSLLLLFYVGVFVFGPPVLPDYKHQMLGILSALLGGLFAYFLAGQIVTSAKWTISKGVQIGVRGTGGFGFALLFLFWWGHGPIESSSQAATRLQQQLEAAAGNATTSSSSTSPVPGEPHHTTQPSTDPRKTITLSPEVAKLAKDLAASDSKYAYVGSLEAGKQVPVATLTRLKENLAVSQKK